MKRSKKYLSTEGLLEAARYVFKNTKTPQINGKRKKPIPLHDCLMSGLALFMLKYPSLLKFDSDFRENHVLRSNMQTLFGVENLPSDTYMRERLDEVGPEELRRAFTMNFAQLQRGKALEQFKFINNTYLLALDGTGVFESDKVHCDNCCVKNHKEGHKSYYHQILCSALVHPDQRVVVPFAPEPIMKEDGATKNDCETNAGKRFIDDFRREHPHLKVTLLTDSLFSKGPFIKMLIDARINYLMGVKPGDHKSLFEFVEGVCHTFTCKINGLTYNYRYLNDVPLNDTHQDIRVNFFGLTIIDATGKESKFTWITNHLITTKNIELLAKGGRTRWYIENQTINTLKNRGYQFEHNFGHGYKNLTTVFSTLMMLAFMIDQIQELCHELFQKALVKAKRLSYLWSNLQTIFFGYYVASWDDMWTALAFGFKNAALQLHDSS
jgi:hypothetical protein